MKLFVLSKIYQNQCFPRKNNLTIYGNLQRMVYFEVIIYSKDNYSSIRKSITSLKSFTTIGLQSFNTINSNKVLKHFQADFL